MLLCSVIDPMTLTFEHQNSTTSRVHPGSFRTPSLNTLGLFVFELCCGQTDRRTNSKILPNPTAIVDVGNNVSCAVQLLRKSYNELKLLEAMISAQNEGSPQNDSCSEASKQAAAGRQQELIEKVLKNIAVASEVLFGLLRVNRL